MEHLALWQAALSFGILEALSRLRITESVLVMRRADRSSSGFGYLAEPLSDRRQRSVSGTNSPDVNLVGLHW